MSFLDIKDPKKRDAIVNDYLATVKRLQQRNLNEKAQDLVRHEDIERALEPVVRSTGKSTEMITKELIPIKDEIKALNERLEKRENNDREERQQQEQEEEENVVQAYYRKVRREKLDKYFGVIMEGGRYKMGDKYVHIEGSDVVIGHKKYIGTKGLWSLIMRKHPTDYSPEDLVTYRDVIHDTNAMTRPNNLDSTSRVASTKKWREIFPLFDILDEKEKEGELSSHHHHEGAEEAVSTSAEQSRGNGIIQFLPGDIKGMETKLNYLLGEYRAGNRSSYTRNEIVSILDELLRRKRISRKEYQDINTSFLK